MENKYKWFEDVLGFEEKDFNYSLEEIPSNIREKMGNFEQQSILELKKTFERKKKKNNSHIKLVVRYRNSYSHEISFDTSAIQFYSKENAVFQVASNFNCLEIPRAEYNPFNGYFLTKQMTDNTQGPSASGGTAFGSILRLIKHKEKRINLLEDTPLIANNGKLKYSENKNFKKFNPDLIKIGLQKNVEANFLRLPQIFKYNQNGVKINQVFTSTCICNDSTPNDLSRILLEKAYEGTYLCAIITQAPTLILTLIGGGVFNNSLSLIIEIIMKTHEAYEEYLPKDCEVILPVFEAKPNYILSEFKKYENVSIELVG
jgi:hypothetical protein